MKQDLKKAGCGEQTNQRANLWFEEQKPHMRTTPSYIVIEDLNISEVMKNKHLSKAVASQKLYELRIKLEAKCREQGIELRIADR